MKGRRIAVLGLGRSGLAIARAAKRLGAEPVVYDQKSRDALAKPELADEAEREEIALHLGWQGDPVTGADLLVVNPAVPRSHPALHTGIEVIGEIEFAYRITRAPIVAITGTNGKSTTTVMTYLCLRACGREAVLCGNIFGSGYAEAPLTEAALNSTPEQVLVAEVSSFQLEWVSQFKPQAAAITNIGADHLDRYEDASDYARTKLRIFDAMGPGEHAIVPAELEARVPKGPALLTFGAEGRDACLQEGDLRILDFVVPLEDLPRIQGHNLANAMAAGLLASAVVGEGRVAAEPIGVGLRSYSGLAHRMEFVGEKRGVQVVNNSMCTNPEAVVSSAKSVVGRAHLLIGGVNKGLDFAPLRDYLAESGHRAYIFGTDAADLSQMLDGNYEVFDTLDHAFEAAAAAAKSGETIMLAPGCASTDQFRDFRERGDVFKAMAKEWLRT